MMKLTLSLGAFLVLGAPLVAWTTAPATVIRSDGCSVVDANGVHYFDADCRLQIVENDNGYLVQAQGRLPEGAALPNRALRRDITELGFSGHPMQLKSVWRPIIL
jgi:hypothetical protein